MTEVPPQAYPDSLPTKVLLAALGSASGAAQLLNPAGWPFMASTTLLLCPVASFPPAICWHPALPRGSLLLAVWPRCGRETVT